MTTAEKENAYTFKAEIKQLLDILIHSLYKEPEIFVRELISNASDALTRFQFEQLTNRDVVDPDAELAITLETRKPDEGDENGEHWLIIKDTGIGMTADEMRQNLGTIAQSGAREFLQKLRSGEVNTDGQEMGDVIGQFGVGFYSVFMAAEEVRVVSRSYQPEAEAAVWISDGGERYRIEPAEKTERGTEIHIKLRDEAKEFADNWKLRQIIKKHSDFVAFPIYLMEERENEEGETEIEPQQLNQQQSLWRKQPSDVEQEDYNSFYQQMTLDFEPPLATIHFRSDAPLNLRALLFVPAKREKTMFAKRTEPGVMLYSKNILIQEYCDDLFPKWLGFVDGVVDSEDLPLNVSRESVQNSRIMRQLGKTVRKRVLRELKKLGKDEPEKYAEFWKEYGRFFKEGVATDFEARAEIMPYLRFYSSKSDGELITLDEYVARMPEAQEEIYYVLGDDARSVANSPHLDPFTARDIEVLYFVDAFDAFMAPGLTDFQEKAFRNVDDGSLELPDIAETADETSSDEPPAANEESFKALLEKFGEVLGERVTEVRASKVLKGSPARLVSPEDAAGNQSVSRLQRYIDQNYEVPKRILELNQKHPLVVSLADQHAADGESARVPLIIEQLFDSALVQEGLHPNPAEMLPRIQKLMEMAAGG